MTSVNDPLVTRPVTTEDGHHAPQKYQSSEIVVAAKQLSFAAKEKKQLRDAGDDEAKDSYEEENIRNAQTKDKAEVAKDYDSDLKNGMTAAGVENARKKFGFNELTPKKQLHWTLKLLLSIFGSEFNILLWVGAGLCFIMYGLNPNDDVNLYLGITLATVVTITGIFGYYQESKSSDIMESFKSFESNDCEVVRDGGTQKISPRELVPGDLVSLKAGDKIPADIRITQCSSNAQVNNASLTGEADPQDRNWVVSTQVPLEAKNMCFFGTLMMRGNLQGMVVASGDYTFMGTVAKLAQETETVQTPIAIEISHFVHVVSAIAGFLGVSFFIIGMIDNKDFIKNIIFLIGIIVANVPEGLLATVTVSLTLTANRMGQKMVQVKNLESVETLGSTSVICSDKTGTLTTSIMTVKHVLFDLAPQYTDTHKPWKAIKQLRGAQFYSDDGNVLPSFARLLRIGLLCNNAKELEGRRTRDVAGDATESAVYKFCEGHVASQHDRNKLPFKDTKAYRAGFEKLHEIPFNSSNKWQVSVHVERKGQDFETSVPAEFENQRPIVVLKGAPEKVLAMCDSYLFEGKEEKLTEEVKHRIMAEQRKLAEKGERVLGFADVELDPEEFDLNRPKPEIFGNPKEKMEPFQGVYVKRGDEEPVKVPLADTDKNGNPVPFKDLKFSVVYEAYAELVGEKAGCVTLVYGTGEGAGAPAPLERQYTLKDMEVEEGSVLHAYMGPYKFEGTTREEANWPFGRDGERGLVFVGLYSMIDPARPGVPEAVRSCQDAGIKVIMVTGDHPVTAHAIAKEVNIIGKDPKTQKHHMTKQEVAKMKFGDETRINDVPKNDPLYRAALVPGQKSKDTIPGWTVQEQEAKGQKNPAGLVQFWNEVLSKDSVVFARTSPEQKLKIVQACQERGGVVAVTGDGVNDSPALKKADIGVAMGITGTEVAKESADMILKDDNFASIVNGVMEGRIIFDNLKKSIAYTLSSNIPEIAPFLVYQLFKVPLPLTTVMILMVDLGTDLAPAISLAHERAEADIMSRPPRDQKKDNLVTSRLISFAYLQIGCIQALAGFFAYMVVLMGFGFHPKHLPALDENNLFVTSDIYSINGPNIHTQGWWLYCMEWSDLPDDKELSDEYKAKVESKEYPLCQYAPDPSTFTCWWNTDSLWDQTTGLPNPAVTECIGNGDLRKASVNSQEVKAFSDLMESNGAPVKPLNAKGDDETFVQSYLIFREWLMNVPGGGYSNQKSGKRPAASSLNQPIIATIEEVLRLEGRDSDADEWKRQTETCDDEPAMFRLYLEVLYEMMPKYTYLSYDVQRSRQCHVENVYFGARWNTGMNPSFDAENGGGYNCDTYDVTVDPKTAQTNWAYWKTENRHCTVLANCDADMGNGGITADSSDPSVERWTTIFPINVVDRTTALAGANTAYFISIIIVQWADLMICKTRSRSLFEQGMTNVFMNYSLFFETCLGACLVYLPFCNQVFQTRPMKFVWWCAAVPFSIFIYVYDELRKGYIRGHRGGWLERNTYW